MRDRQMLKFLIVLAFGLGASVALAQQAPGSDMALALPGAAGFPVQGSRGPETGLPLPRYVSLKTSEGRARRGPSREHRVDWHFTRRDMPLRVTAEFEHWRRVEDAEGQGGWMHHSLLSGVRTALVVADLSPMRARAHDTAAEVALLEHGVVARILECQAEWCRLRVDGHRGWVRRSALWGVDAHEMRD